MSGRAAKLWDVRDPDFQVRVFTEACIRRGLPAPTPEFVFAKPRKWAFDFSWEATKIALEVEGGLWVKGGGRHNRAKGFLADLQKYNTATSLGWRVFRCTPQTLCSSVTLTLLENALAMPRIATVEPRSPEEATLG